MDELYRSENLVVRRVPAQDQNRWVVTFDHYGIGHGFDREGFGESFLKAQGISAIHVMGRREDWYQYPDLEAALATVKAAVAGASRVMTYGSSMGAYAAVRFADAAGAHAALALSPQYSIDPTVAPFEKRWLQDVARIEFLPHLNGPFRSQARLILVYDPMTDDRRHAEMISRHGTAEHLRVPFAGHPAGPFLAESGVFLSVILEALEGSADTTALRRIVRSKRGSSAIYHAHLAGAQPGSRRRLAIRIARRGVEVNPLSSHALHQLADLVLAEGDHDEAIALHERGLAASGRHYSGLISYANALQAAGRADEALEAAYEVVAHPDLARTAHIQAWFGMIAWNAGRSDEAIAAARAAVRLQPRNPSYRRLCREYRMQRDSAGPTRAILERARDWLAVRWS